jgi:hypothetical protein
VYSPELIDSQRWIGVKSVLCIERWGEREGKAYPHKAYAISSVATSASQWQGIVREHWGIENRLHWPKDKVFGEDDYLNLALCFEGTRRSRAPSKQRTGSCLYTSPYGV